VASATAFTLLNGQALTMLLLIQTRITQSTLLSTMGRSLFPYYLIPSGISNLWGLQPIATFYHDPLQSALIACGLLLTAAALGAVVWLLFRSDTPAAPMLCAMALFYAFAFHRREAFTLYKMAMYVQPFLIPVCVSGIAALASRNDRITRRVHRERLAGARRVSKCQRRHPVEPRVVFYRNPRCLARRRPDPVARAFAGEGAERHRRGRLQRCAR
jgi:hypothetical protein